MKTTAARFLSLAILAGSVASANAADMFLGAMNGRNFFVTDTTRTATQQIAYANSVGGVLASIHSQAEMDFLHNATLGLNDYVWIGFTDDAAYGATEGNFRWLDGSVVDYTFWNSPPEPNNEGGFENFTIMNWTATGRWNDRPDGYSGYGLYTTVAPGPAAALPFALLALRRRRRKA